MQPQIQTDAPPRYRRPPTSPAASNLFFFLVGWLLVGVGVVVLVIALIGFVQAERMDRGGSNEIEISTNTITATVKRTQAEWRLYAACASLGLGVLVLKD